MNINLVKKYKSFKPFFAIFQFLEKLDDGRQLILFAIHQVSNSTSFVTSRTIDRNGGRLVSVFSNVASNLRKEGLGSTF